MTEIYKPSSESSQRAWVKSMAQYKELYERSINDPEKFWTEEAEKFTWFKKWDRVRDYNYDFRKGKIFVEWFKGAQTNITVNCIDRHINSKGDQTDIILTCIPIFTLAQNHTIYENTDENVDSTKNSYLLSELCLENVAE